MNIRNRVKSLRMVPASDLRPNPKNWRTHPKAQQDALRGVLAEVGLADACLARELPDGSLMLIDGHLRAETLGDGDVPVLILDVNEAEADKLLATLDPLAAMAESDAAKLDELLRNVDTGSEALQQMLASTASEAGLYAETSSDSNEEKPEQADSELPERQSLAERFGVAPFSVLNAREGWWQDRKRAWIAIGIQSELGRGEGWNACPGGSPMVSGYDENGNRLVGMKTKVQR
jgi:ParB-like chromosome segregation protein Spo0J